MEQYNYIQGGFGYIEAGNSIVITPTLANSSGLIAPEGSVLLMRISDVLNSCDVISKQANGIDGIISKEAESGVNNEVKIYPNPSNYQFNISYQLKSEQNVKISIYSTDMKLVKQILHPKQSLGTYIEVVDASNFNSGIYFAKIERGNDVQTRK